MAGFQPHEICEYLSQAPGCQADGMRQAMGKLLPATNKLYADSNLNIEFYLPNEGECVKGIDFSRFGGNWEVTL